MLPLKELVKRAEERSLNSDYWKSAAQFLKEVEAVPMAELSLKQRNWLHAIRQDLREPWE